MWVLVSLDASSKGTIAAMPEPLDYATRPTARRRRPVLYPALTMLLGLLGVLGLVSAAALALESSRILTTVWATASVIALIAAIFLAHRA